MITEFEHKFKVKDTVWFIKDNKPTQSYITKVEYTEQDSESVDFGANRVIKKVTYQVFNKGYTLEYQIFETKQELLNSL